MNNPAAPVTRAMAIGYFNSEVSKSPDLYFDCGELNSTRLAENAQDHFGVMTDEGNSLVEQELFDWSAEFSMKYNPNRYQSKD